MDISPTTAISTTTSSNAQISSDFETFLQMLTTQIENQDPLNPIESSDFAVQLATFSSVEQQVLTNDLLRDLSTSLSGNDISNYANWIGRDVRSGTPAYFDGTTVHAFAELPDIADRNIAVVSDQSGAEVHRFALPDNTSQFSWDGATQSGAVAAPGAYTISVESYRGDALLEIGPVETYKSVREITSDAQLGVMLVLGDGSLLDPGDVSGLRIE